MLEDFYKKQKQHGSGGKRRNAANTTKVDPEKCLSFFAQMTEICRFHKQERGK